MHDYLNTILTQIGMGDEVRRDAKFTAALDQALEEVKAKTYDVKYPALKGRSFVPVNTSTDPGAETITYQQWDEYGMAEIIANYADDLGMVDVKAEKFSSPVHSLGKAYQFSVEDLRRSALAGNSLDARRARACRRAFELKLDELIAFGDAKGKLKGLLNHPNVTVLTAANDGTATEWVTGRATPKSAANIQADMFTCTNNIRTTTLEVHQANTILLGTVEHGHISQAAVGTDNQTTILRSFLANNPNITSIESWHKLDTADAAGTGPRLVCYEKDPENLELELPLDFEQFPPQARNLAFVVPCHGRVGGVIMYYPLSMVYMDGV